MPSIGCTSSDYPAYHLGTILAAYAAGLWFDNAHAVSTVIFLLLLAKLWGKLLNRIKIKYGLMEEGAEKPAPS